MKSIQGIPLVLYPCEVVETAMLPDFTIIFKFNLKICYNLCDLLSVNAVGGGNGNLPNLRY